MLFGYKILAFCTCKIYQDRFCSFISGLNEELIKNNWRVMVFDSPSNLFEPNENDKGARNIFDLINYKITDALLISEEDILDEGLKIDLINKAQKNNIPVIVIGKERQDTYNIYFDEKKGFEQIVRHIVEDHKKTKIHFFAGTVDSYQSNNRLEVVKKVMADNNLPFEKENISYGDFWDIPTRREIEKIVKTGNLPQAFICANDTMALTVISVLEKHNIKCPEDILVTGFDGIQGALFSSPKITTALCDYTVLGIETAKFIFDILENPKITPSRYVDTVFLLSESCGCKNKENSNTMAFINFLSDSYNRYRFEDSSLMNMSVSLQSCNTLDEVRNILQKSFLSNVCCLLKSEFVIEDKDPGIKHSLTTYGDAQYILLDTDATEPPSSNYIKTEDYIPRMESILKDYQMPLIFVPLNNLNQPIGYLCFCFLDYDKQDFAKVTQIASWLSIAITGFRNIQYQKKLQNKIEKMYSHDALTGLYNRIGFQKIYNKILEDPSITKISLAMCDLDNLKHINDNYSHNEGDSAINTVGKALSSAITDGYFCRYGGDEIIGLYPYEVDTKELQSKIDSYLKNYNAFANKPYEVSTSLGIFVSEKTSFDKMFSEADNLMYKQKTQKKKNRKE